MDKDNFLAVDVGNTSISLGLFTKGKLIRKTSLPTDRFEPVALQKKRSFVHHVKATFISSVVPDKTDLLKDTLQTLTRSPVKVIGQDIRVPIRNKTRYPRQVGTDRLLGALQAFQTYKTACIIIDFGTAITFDVVSRSGEYRGGIIAPGVDLVLNALYEKAALLPRIRLTHPRDLIGDTTIECIRSGVSFGLGALCEGILKRLKQRLKHPLHVLATGGYARYMSRYTRNMGHIDENLILKGIYTLYQRAFRL